MDVAHRRLSQAHRPGTQETPGARIPCPCQGEADAVAIQHGTTEGWVVGPEPSGDVTDAGHEGGLRLEHEVQVKPCVASRRTLSVEGTEDGAGASGRTHGGRGPSRDDGSQVHSRDVVQFSQKFLSQVSVHERVTVSVSHGRVKGCKDHARAVRPGGGEGRMTVARKSSRSRAHACPRHRVTFGLWLSARKDKRRSGDLGGDPRGKKREGGALPL